MLRGGGLFGGFDQVFHLVRGMGSTLVGAMGLIGTN